MPIKNFGVFKPSKELEKISESQQRDDPDGFMPCQWRPSKSKGPTVLNYSYIHLGDFYCHPESPNIGYKLQSQENFNHSKKILLDLKQTDTSNSRIDFLLGLIERRLQAM